ncbi:MAG: elongation factor Ts [Bacilli bacterium]|nr:elongation factor Ts [Bacilli bacterium]MCI9433773.1 elongation factor Ts [Bacilli bacterium]
MVSPSLVKDLREMTGAGMLDCKKALDATNGNIDEAVNWLREKGIAKAAKKADRVAAEGIASILIQGNNAVIVEVNSETDFVAKNEEFLAMVQTILKTIIDSDAQTLEDVLALTTNGETIESLIINKTAKIGERLNLRRFKKITKNDNEQFGSYIHMGGKIATLIVTENTTEEVAKDVAMHAAAMRPLYLKSDEVPTDVLEKEKEVIKEQLINEGKPADRIDSILVGKINKYYEDVALENQIFIKAENKESVAKYVANNGGKISSMTRYEVGEGIEKKEENFADEVAKQINNI